MIKTTRCVAIWLANSKPQYIKNLKLSKTKIKLPKSVATVATTQNVSQCTMVVVYKACSHKCELE